MCKLSGRRTGEDGKGSLGNWVGLVAANAICLGRLGRCAEVTKCSVVHGSNLETDCEHYHRRDDSQWPSAVRIEVPAELAVEGVPVPALELRVDLRVREVLVLSPDACPELDAHGVRRQRHRHRSG